MKTDTITKDYVRNADIFADIFNYYIYDGEQVVRPEQLTERDSTKIALPYGEDGLAVPVQKFRDVQKLYSVMTDGQVEYVLYGAENQAEIHYVMPVKNNLYDLLELRRLGRRSRQSIPEVFKGKVKREIEKEQKI